MENQEEPRYKFNDILLYTNNLKALDGFVTVMRTHLANEGTKTNWILKPFGKALVSLPFKHDATASNLEKAASFFVNPITILGITFLGMGNAVSLYLSEFSSYWWFIIAGILYATSVTKGFIKQLDYCDSSFDINAFKYTFPELYHQLRVFKNTEPFSFEVLHSHVERLSETGYEKMASAIDEISAVTKEKRVLKERIKQVENLLESTSKEVALKTLLFEKAIAGLQAISNDAVSKDILHVITDFALFRLEGDYLIAVAKHHAYNTPEKINIKDSEQSKWAVVKAANANGQSDALQLDQSHDRVVIANKFNIKGVTFVYSFHLPSNHFDETTYFVTDSNSQTLLYNLIMVYTKNEGGNKNDNTTNFGN